MTRGVQRATYFSCLLLSRSVGAFHPRSEWSGYGGSSHPGKEASLKQRWIRKAETANQMP